MKKLLIVFGTRPEAIKMAPVIKELQKHPHLFKTIVCVTAQHREMLDQVLALFKIRPDFDLDIMAPGQGLHEVAANVLMQMKGVLDEVKPDMVFVHGDTTTTMMASLSSFYSGIPVGHVEAGLRTGNKRAPFPEELNRRVAGCIADLHFAPTAKAKENLLHEGTAEETIFVTGNTVIDALFMAVDEIERNNLTPDIIERLTSQYPAFKRILADTGQERAKRLILVTGHRRENFGPGFENICYALKEIANTRPDVEILYPVHLNPNVQEPVMRILAGVDNIHLIAPVDYLLFVYLMGRAHFIITDSGGVQEEAPSMGKPVLVMRETTERPEAVEAGTVKLVGIDKEIIVKEALKLLDNESAYTTMSQAHNPYGDGKAAKRIVEVITGNCRE